MINAKCDSESESEEEKKYIVLGREGQQRDGQGQLVLAHAIAELNRRRHRTYGIQSIQTLAADPTRN